MAFPLSKFFKISPSLVFALVMHSGIVKAGTLPADGVPTPTSVVEMRSISFFPKKVVVAEGQAVEWKNVSLTDHSATSNDEGKSFDTSMVPPKASKVIVFTKAGQYTYHCTMHGRTMSAVVLVNPKP